MLSGTAQGEIGDQYAWAGMACTLAAESLFLQYRVRSSTRSRTMLTTFVSDRMQAADIQKLITTNRDQCS